jgi:PmbA protein
MGMAEAGGDQEMSWESDFSPYFEKLDPKWTARRAAEQAVSLLGARPISTRKVPALLDPVVGASLLGVLASSFLGDQVVKGKSSLKDRLGEQVYTKTLSIIDDGRKSDGYGSAPFDGEGTRTEQTTLVEKGVLRSFLHDRASAVRLKQKETGNGVRPTFKELPRSGVTNFFLQPGDRTFDQLRDQMGRGLWITDLIGVHTANPISGDFSLGASGFLASARR